ncbi:hypothetical protein [Geobacter sp. SVR]|uniref:hypothetical protein n=1 Tax=Geobacter sp. SVR TaxID=2495594 RepID=UPI00143EF573|nr:hypothetical protein [Geobacter sp. SVR]BCS54777.1 hypothetical protein GSVR_30850 [Geobacter sp. SVR]GCF86415.1 hypothetical protein GSbR_30150 [Geobacter sp. SVR]
MPLYKAIKEGWDGRKIIKPGTIFPFDGPKGSWMVECDSSGKVKAGEKDLIPDRPVRAGASQPKGLTRDDLRKQLKDAGVKFPATAGAPALAELLRTHQEKVAEADFEKQSAGKSSENPDGGAPGVGNQDVI